MIATSTANGRATPSLTGATTFFTLIGLAVLALYVFGFGHVAASLINSLDEELGEVLMERGIDFEAAGQTANAKETYLEALERPFYGEQNRADTLKRLGMIYWEEGQYDAALPYLRNAASCENPPRSVFEPLVDCLAGLNRFEEAEEVLHRWLSLMDKDAHELARAKYYEGRLALVRGDRKHAELAFLEGVKAVPGGRNAAELASMYYLEDRYSEALPYVNEYLKTGSGQRAEYMRSVRERILERMNAVTKHSEP